MIYAIRAASVGMIKFGRAKHVGRRLVELDQASPVDLEVLATADWPDGAETGIHQLLDHRRRKGEWFAESRATDQVVNYMLDVDNGLKRLREELQHLGRRWA